MAYLLDTNIWVYAYRNQGACRQRIDQIAPKHLHLCAINVYEIEFGISKSKQPKALRTFLNDALQRYPLVEFNIAAAKKAGQIRASLETKGQPIGSYDVLIASIALSHNLTLVTRNVREFERIPDLKVENWYEA